MSTIDRLWPLEGAELWVLPNPSGLNAHYQLPQLVELFAGFRDAIRRQRPEYPIEIAYLEYMSPTLERFIAHCKAGLANYKVPAAVIPVECDQSLPSLASRYSSPGPGPLFQ